MSEAANSWILDERDQTWFSCLSGIVRKSQQRMHAKRVEYRRMETVYVPWVEALVRKFTKMGRKRLISTVAYPLYEVKRNSTSTFAVVDIEERTCSCHFWSEHKYPCVHACAAIIFRGEEPVDYISDYYRTSHLQEVFAPYSHPVDVEYLVPDGTLPPSILKRRGRPKKVRIRNRSEYVNDDSPYRCSKCQKVGHNVRTCDRRGKT